MKNLLLLTLFFILFSCGSKKKFTETKVAYPDTTSVDFETVIPTPESRVSIGHELTLSQSNLYVPFREVIRDEVAGNVLTLSVDTKGKIQADCISEPDTVRVFHTLRIPTPIPCPEPLPAPKPKPRIFLQIFAFWSGFIFAKIFKKDQFKKLYDRFKNLIPSKFRQ